VLLSSAIFALMHNEAFVFAGLFAFGILLAYLFEKHQNLWLPISVHFFNNLFANAAVFIIKYTDVIKTLEG
jgi:membrane protease YdiL (CAAX protease family)